MAAKVEFLIDFNDKEVIAKFKKLEDKADECRKRFGQLHKQGKDIDDIFADQKAIKNMEKLNKLLNDGEKHSSKFADANKKAFENMEKSIFKSVTAVNVLMKGLSVVGSLISKGFHTAYDFASEGYEKAVQFEKEKSGIRGRLGIGPETEKIINSLDDLSHKLVYYGISMEETMEVGKQSVMMFPKANAAAIHNLTAVAGLISKVKEISPESVMNTLKLVATQGMEGKQSLRSLERLNFTNEEILKYDKDIKLEKKGLISKKDPDEYMNILLKTLYKNSVDQAKAMADSDPLQFFKAKMEETQLTIGQTVLKAFKDPGIQNLLNYLVNRLKTFVENLKPGDIAGAFETLLEGATTFANMIASLAETFSFMFHKSKWQLGREESSFTNWLSQGSKFTSPSPLLPKIDPFTGLPVSSASNERQAGFEHFTQEMYNKRGHSGDVTMEDQKAFMHELIENLKPENKETLETLKRSLDPKSLAFVNSFASSFLAPKYDPKTQYKAPDIDFFGGGKFNQPSANSLNIENEASRVTGQRPQVININIDKQIGEVHVTEVDLTKTTHNKVNDNILAALEEALMTAQLTPEH